MTKITDDAEELLCISDFPTGHWQHLKTSNPIESTFSSVRLGTRVTKGPGSKAAGWRWRSSCWSRPSSAGERSTAAAGRAGARPRQVRGGVLVERPAEPSEQAV